MSVCVNYYQLEIEKMIRYDTKYPSAMYGAGNVREKLFYHMERCQDCKDFYTKKSNELAIQKVPLM